MGETASNGELEFAKPQQTIEWGGHPLFPRAEAETGPDTRRFDIIHIHRCKGDGSREICPKAWRGADLRSWEQIVVEYGGGTYQLVAQCSRTHRFQAFSEKMQFAGPSKPFVAVNQIPPVTETAHPSAPPAVPPPIHSPAAPYTYPYPPPPAASGNAETFALVRAIIESNNAEKSALMRALLERPGKESGSLEVVREILPFMQGGAGGTNALMQGVELARKLIGHGNQPAPGQGQTDDMALLGQVLRMIAPAAAASAIASPAPPAPASPPPAITSPPTTSPPGCAWGYTASGWVLVQLPQSLAPAPIAPQAQPTQTAANTHESPASTSSTTKSGIEEVLADAEVGKLFASLSALKGIA